MRINGGMGVVAAVMMMVVVTGCGDSEPPLGQEGAGSDPSSASDTLPTQGDATETAVVTSDASTSPSADSTESASGGSDDTSDTGEPDVEETGVIRFVAFGDSGEGNEAQQMVANAAEIVCADRGCDFALLLGDNFYDVGVTSTMDQQFIDKFEVPYEGLDMPFYIVLGNHDYGVLANDWGRGIHQLEYTEFSDKWTMPGFWYTFSSDSGGTQFFAFDTARMMWSHDVDVQREWLAQEMAASTASWKIAFAHHPYISNGAHGNAGNYEGFPGFPVISGLDVQSAIQDYVCGQAQIYISGHDHNRQVFDPVCGTYFFVSGAAAKTSDFEHRDDNPTQWEDDTLEGFLWVEVGGTQTTAAFYDLDANLDHEMTVNL